MERLVPLVEVVQPTQQHLLQQQMVQPRLTWPQGRLQMLPDIPMQQQHSLTGPTMERVLMLPSRQRMDPMQLPITLSPMTQPCPLPLLQMRVSPDLQLEI